jgi:hypothetical protein
MRGGSILKEDFSRGGATAQRRFKNVAPLRRCVKKFF